MYLYETHCHSKETSACSSLTAENIVELYLANGYDGVFITDHFLNGNTTVHRKLQNASYEQKIEAFCEGFFQVKKLAGDRLKIFFGLEYSYLGSDMLIYGWSPKQLKGLERILSMRMSSLPDFCRETGALAIQAHPFREAHYIDHIRLYPTAEGVEIFNATNGDLCNNLGKFYANSYKKIVIGGSDCHHIGQETLSGVAFEEKINSEQEFITALRQGKGKIFKKPNALIK